MAAENSTTTIAEDTFLFDGIVATFNWLKVSNMEVSKREFQPMGGYWASRFAAGECRALEWLGQELSYRDWRASNVQPPVEVM
jgi:hypothetical protein